MNAIQLRQARGGDLPTLLAFEQGIIAAERAYNSRIKTAQVHYYDIEALIQDRDALLLVATDGDRLVGTGHVQIRDSKAEFAHERHAYLGLMYVEPAYRGQGIIQRIMKDLLQWARSRGIRDHYLDVYAGNAAAVRAYEKFGFEPHLLEMKITD